MVGSDPYGACTECESLYKELDLAAKENKVVEHIIGSSLVSTGGFEQHW